MNVIIAGEDVTIIKPELLCVRVCACARAGRVHSATVKTVSAANATVHVEWSEKESTKGKEVG